MADDHAPWGTWVIDTDALSGTSASRWWGWKDDWTKALQGAGGVFTATVAVSNGLSSPEDSDAYREGYRAGYRDGWKDGRDDD
ncbi:MAG: hypothetical protein IPK85_02245 [Gemmatimonadetes bacterium]|nr:hypothetical protein [Gemmatimonadota bacterium]